MSDNDKISIKSGWFQFLITQLVAFLVYSVGLAYWLGGFSNKVEQHDRQIAAHELRITELDKTDTLPGRLTAQAVAAQERRLTTLEENMNIMRPKVDVMANQLTTIDKKLDQLLEAKK